ncbi:Peptide deformylase 1 [bioreactor metagenome]|uniref:Peptide deformylase 1 n=1 Tax=bioreactor metagenome TaxID=1076179 RepID=A0A644X427_9ZZZZ
MALRKIYKRGDSVLNKTAHPVTKFDHRLFALLDDLKETLLSAGGVGLAAPQIGILRRAVVVIDGKDNIIELINPVIVMEAGEQNGYEGCLSLPGLYGMVKRPMRVRVRAQDRTGKFFEAEDEGMTARCFCHELEHLDGHLFVEHTDKLYTVEELEQMTEDEEEGDA